MAICSVDGCEKEAKQKGWCWAHYTRWRRYGDPLEAKRCAPNLTPPEKCTIDGCDNKHLAKGMCSKHYNRVYRHGDTDTRLRVASGEHMEWMLKHVSDEDGECLTWPFKAKTCVGYAVTSFEGGTANACRVMCILAHGNPPTPNHEAAHSCGKGHEGCVHPKHLRWATRTENHADKKLHGTHLCGEMIKNSKLTEIQAREIRASKLSVPKVMALYGISRAHVYDIRSGRRWAHLK